MHFPCACGEVGSQEGLSMCRDRFFFYCLELLLGVQFYLEIVSEAHL